MIVRMSAVAPLPHSVLNRSARFEQLRSALPVAWSDANAVVVQGDSLEMLRKLPESSVSLILTDPPYHSTKKANITGDTDFEEDEHFLDWMEQYAKEWKRVLKMSGTLYVFCATEMSARLEVMISRYMRPINHVVWTKPNEPGYDGWKGKMSKESMRKWYPHSERLLVFEHGSYGTYEAYRRSPLGEYLLEARKASGLSMAALTEAAGAYGKVNHGGAVANWEAGRNIPSPEQYGKVKEAIEATGKYGPMLSYEDLVRPMSLTKDVEFTDVWNFMSVRPFRGKHPAEKPQDMLMHVIEASSYPGDIVLDCFAGSGSTALAALRLGRRVIAIELEEEWVNRAIEDLKTVSPDEDWKPVKRTSHMTKKTPATLQLDGLFD
jgi:adenine-specific DNA-methyltransferase